MLVFSTCWNSHRHQDGEEMIDEILSLGFDHVELSHGIKLSLLPGIMRAVEAGKVRVAGVHNYFPAPIDEVGDAPDSRPFTADLPQVRSKAIELTKKSIEQGASLGAGYIVLHMGTVEPLVKRTDTTRLQTMAREGLVGTEEFARTKGEFVRRRNRLAPVYVERAREAIRQLLPHASEFGVKLGIEGRQIYIASRIHLSDITAESEETIRQNIVNLAFRADEMDNMMVERFGCEFSEYSKTDAEA